MSVLTPISPPSNAPVLPFISIVHLNIKPVKNSQWAFERVSRDEQQLSESGERELSTEQGVLNLCWIRQAFAQGLCVCAQVLSPLILIILGLDITAISYHKGQQKKKYFLDK